MAKLHINDGDDNPCCGAKSAKMTADPDESNCEACKERVRIIENIVETIDDWDRDTLVAVVKEAIRDDLRNCSLASLRSLWASQEGNETH